MAPIRIALVQLPRILEEIATRALSEPGLEIVETVQPSTLGLADRIASAGADVVVLGSNDVAVAVELLDKCPGVTVIAVAGEGESAWLYAAEREPVSLGTLSPSGLVRAVRAAGVRNADDNRLNR